MAESDPNGKGANEPGAKLDSGKVRAGLAILGFSEAISKVAEVTTFGAGKYTPDGWRSVPDGEQRYLDAAFRHLLKMPKQELDDESKLSHLAHAAWNLLAVLELQLCSSEASDDSACG